MAGGDVGAALVVALALVVSATVVAAGLGRSLLTSRPGALSLVVVAVGAGIGIVGWLRPKMPRHGAVAALVLAVPALGVAVTTVVLLLRGAPGGIAWFLNGDHPRHAVLVASVWEEGNLSYALERYPRGWHAALAAVWSATGAGLDAASVDRLLLEMSVASLVLSAMLALATAHLGHAIAGRVGLGPRAAVAAGLVAGSATLLNPVLANYQALGYENSLLTAVVLAVCCREVLLRPGGRVSLVVCAAGLLVVAHSWQLLLPPVVVAAAGCGWPALRHGTRRERATAVACALGAITVAIPGVVAVAGGAGLASATLVGPDSPVPMAVLVIGTTVTLFLAARRHDGGLRVAAAATLLPVGTALALCGWLGLPLLRYYPSKLLWQGVVLSLPWLAAGGCLAVMAALDRWPGASAAVRGVGAGLCGLFVAYCLLMPWGSQLGIWSTVDAARVLAAVETPRAKDATVVWLQDSVTTDSVARILLDVMRVAHPADRAPQSGLAVAQECALLRRAEHPAVLSTAPVDAVRQRYACSPGVTVLPVGPLGPAAQDALRRPLVGAEPGQP